MKKSHINIIRWIARILDILVGLILLLFGILSRILYPSDWLQRGETHLEVYLFLGLQILLLASFIIAWSREAIGGVMILGFYVACIALGLFEGELIWGPPIVGLLFLFCWWQSRKLTLRVPSKSVSK
jgi:hypothetical protein